MGIYDRPYYKQPSGNYRGGFPGVPGGSGRGIPHPKRWSVTLWLIVINTAVFLLGEVPPLSNPVTLSIGTGAREDLPRAVLNDATPLPALAEQQPSDPGVFKIPLVRPTTTPQDVPQGALINISGDPNLYEVVGFKTVYQRPDLGVLGGYGHFSTLQGFRRLEVWRLITFQFLHGDFFHLLFNMLGLWIFGGIVEQYLRPRRYLAFYLISGICGALLYLVLNGAGYFGLPLPGALNVSVNTPLVGASAGVFGVIMACAKISPNATVQLLLIPVPIKMRIFAYGYVVIAAFNLFVFQGPNQGGDAAHVGGAIAGYFFIRNAHLLNDFFDVFGRSGQRSGGNSRKPKPARAAKPPRGAPSPEEVDRILAKVSTDGLHSLTDKEKQILNKASKS